MPSHRKPQVTVIGDSAEVEINNRLAYEAGRLIGRKGWTLLSGGRDGVMREAGRGAIEEGGTVVAILPDGDINAGNPYRTVSIPTGIGYARNSMNVLSADAVVVIGGGSGTLSEIGFAWAYGKPVVALTGAEGWGEKLAGTSLDARRNDRIIPAASLEELDSVLTGIIGQSLNGMR